MKENNVISLADIDPETMYNVFTDLEKYNHAMRMKARALNTTVDLLIKEEDKDSWKNIFVEGE